MKIVINESSALPLADRAQIADNFFSRFRGLLGKRSLHPDEALIITQCRQIHMFGMVFSIDAIFCSSDNVVVGMVSSLAPWRISRSFRSAAYVIELPVGTISSSHTQIGDKIKLETA